MMRKKILSLSLLLSLFAVAGCGKTSDSVSTNPTDTPSAIVKPSDKPTEKLTETPTVKPTEAPTQNPTAAPSVSPSERKTIKLSGLSYATIGEQVTLTSSVEGVSYTSSNTLAATVADGVVTAVKAGDVIITAHKDGYKDGTFARTILDPVSAVGNTALETSSTAYKTKGVVLAKGNYGFILADKNGRENAVYAYGKTNANLVNVGDYVVTEGTIDNGDYGFEYKLNSVIVLTSEYTKPVISNDPVIITPDVLDGYNGKGILYGIVKDGTISESTGSKGQKYTNVDYPEGIGGTNMFSFDIAYDYEIGTYDVYGYLCAKTASGNRRTFIAENDGLKTPSKGEPTKITVEADNGVVTIGKGETLQFSASVEPYYATKEVAWSVTGSDKASIDENGLLSISADATAADLVVTATTKFAGGNKTGTYNLKIVDKSITIKAQDLVTVGETIDLSATLSEEGKTPNITYSVDNAEVAEIIDGNKLKGLKAGSVTLTAKRNGYSNATYSIDVLDTVSAAKASANESYVTLKGVVKAVDGFGYILADANDYVYVYAQKAAVQEGDRVKFEGKVKFDSTLPYVFELMQTSVTVLDPEDYQAIASTYEASVRDAAALAALTIKDGAKYVSISAVSVASSSFDLGENSVKVVGKNVADGFYDVKGYIYLNNAKYYRYVTEAKAAARPSATALTFKLGEKANIQLGRTLTLEVEQAPLGARDELTWSVSENAHATVAKGVVTLTDEAAVGDTFTVTVASSVNAEVKATIAVTVIAKAATQTVEINANEFTPTGGNAVIDTTLKNIKFNLSKGIATADYLNVYKGQSLTISIASGSITKIVFTCTAKDAAKQGPGCFELTSEKGAYSYSGYDGTWTLDEGTNSISFKAVLNQVRISKFTITYKA